MFWDVYQCQGVSENSDLVLDCGSGKISAFRFLLYRCFKTTYVYVAKSNLGVRRIYPNIVTASGGIAIQRFMPCFKLHSVWSDC